MGRDAAESTAQIGRGIRKLRKERNWTQDRLAVKAGVDRASLNRLEQGKSNPSLALLEKVALALGTTLTGLSSIGAKTRKSFDPKLTALVGRNIESIRLAKGLNRRQLSVITGFLPQYISTTERGIRLPNLPNFLQFARSFDVRASIILEARDEWTHDVLLSPVSHPSLEEISDRIAEARGARNISMSEAARWIGVSPSHLSLIERGKAHPNLKTILGVCNSLGCSISSLLD